MGRRKKMTEAELENTQTTLTIEDSNQAEAEEAELLASTDSEVVAAPEEAAVVEEEAKPRTRRRRAQKEEEVSEIEVTAVEEAPAVEEAIETPEEPVKKSRKPRAKKAEVTAPATEKETIQAIPTLSPSLDQWAAIKELSDSVQKILEANKKLQIPAASLEYDTSEFFRPQQPKTLFITKFATAASIVAVILSLVSLSLSQSARHAVLSAVDASKQVGIASATSSSSEASPFRKSPRRIK